MINSSIDMGSTYIRVDLDHLEDNFKAIQSHCPSSEVMPILKADAYGHGMHTCAKYYERWGAASFGVATIEEAIALRQHGIKIPILALGGILTSQILHYLEYDVDICVSSIDKLKAVVDHAKAFGRKARIHLKIDTGMERIGIHYYSAEKLLQESLKHSDSIEVVGIYSHLADSEFNPKFTSLQLERFLEVLYFYEKNSLPCPKRHISNSGAILNHPEANLDLVRPGLILYGVDPIGLEKLPFQLKPSLSWFSKVVYFKVVKPGATVSYGCTWEAKEQTRIITVPVGYGDGYPRNLSNTADVLIRGKRYPIAGRVCMDQFMVDIGPEGEAYNADEVVLIGKQGDEEISIMELAKMIDTDPREILLLTHLRCTREYFYKNERVDAI